MKKLTLSLFAACALLSFASNALANGRNPGSLLLFPIYDSRAGVNSIITVTNTNNDISYNPETQLATGTVDVHYVYIDGWTCQEFNRVERLTPNDTLTVVCSHHNPNSSLGYLYVYAKDVLTGEAISWNYLIGNMVSFDGLQALEYGMNPFAFNAIPGEGEITDLDDDGIRDLDGAEYEGMADELLIPRFFAQGNFFDSQLVFVNLTGGSQFTTTIDLLIYNDNEQVFSGEFTFQCWDAEHLDMISGAFTQSFLQSTNHDEDEIRGLDWLESGWARLDGGIASSTQVTINDPAFAVALLEFIGPYAAADLPFEAGVQLNGDLLPRSVQGDN